jgi:Flp pilus assembly pilin Flp
MSLSRSNPREPRANQHALTALEYGRIAGLIAVASMTSVTRLCTTLIGTSSAITAVLP